MGDSHPLHHLHTFAIKKLPGHKDVEAHAHANGRYKVRKGSNEQMPHGSFGSDPSKSKSEQVWHPDDQDQDNAGEKVDMAVPDGGGDDPTVWEQEDD